MSVTDQQRAEWRAEHTPPLNYIDARILALLDALDAAEQRADLLGDMGTEYANDYTDAIERAESAESERDSLAVQLDEALGKVGRVEALAEEWLSEIDWSSGRNNYGDNAAYEKCARDLDEALAGPSPTDEGGES